MLLVLSAGLLLWVGDGPLKADLVIVVSNSVSAALSGSLLALKCATRDRRAAELNKLVSGRRRSPDKAKKQGTPILQGCCETEARFGFALFF
jgi:hypothetical protein